MASQAAVLHPPTKQQIAHAIARGLQAYTLSFLDGFHLIAWACVGALLLVALLRKSPLNYGDLSFPDAGTPAKERTKS